ncbi:hypothetical protein C8R43DRAFT_1111040 [Mycena crocata]|nr:hypothetical protein C8R43DRAFT_1111040 [Mycena crocata]
MAPKYLCCLPLRLGVLVISFLQFLVSALATAAIAYALIANDKFEIPARLRIAAIVLAVVYGLISLISLTGFIGAIRKKESYVGGFSLLLRVFLAIQVAAVTAYIILYIVDKDRFHQLCVADSTDPNRVNACNSNLWVMIVSAIIPLLFQAYGVYIVGSYKQKLHNEKFLRQESFGFKGPNYVAVPEEHHPLTQQPHYPYADNSHSFGPSHV